MKYSLVVFAALAYVSNDNVNAIKMKQKDDEPPPTAADTPSSGYFGADEDDVMNNIFNHYATPVTNAAG